MKDKTMKNLTPVYLRDLNKQNQKSIMEGFERLVEKADMEDREIIVGYYSLMNYINLNRNIQKHTYLMEIHLQNIIGMNRG